MGRRVDDYAADDWEEGEEEYAPLNVPSEYRTLSEAKQTQITVRELWQRYLSRELVLQPDFQRHYVWDVSRASRYIESLLLDSPTPAIFLSEERDAQWIVIDGHQRLETLFRYMQPFLGGPAKAAGKTPGIYAMLPPLTLHHLNVLSELNGKGIIALSDEDRRRWWERELPIVLLPTSVHPTMKYELFARLNQGSMSLNNQELRNCLYRGPYNELIARLSEGQDFLKLWGKTPLIKGCAIENWYFDSSRCSISDIDTHLRSATF